MTARGTERFRNYGAVLQRHEQEMRFKKIIRVFGYFLVILILVLLLVIVYRVERRATPSKAAPQQSSTGYVRPPLL